MTVEEVRRLATETWSDWPFTHLEGFSDAGWDYQVFVVDDEWLLRVPRTAAARTDLGWEMRMLDRLAPRLPLRVPQYVRHARWGGVYRRLAGEGGRALGADAGRPVGQFLAALHATRPPGSRLERRQRAWRHRFDRLARRLEHVVWPQLGMAGAARARAWYATAQARWGVTGPAVTLIHGDLAPQHLLAVAGEVVAVIDFGDMTWGDPMLDFAGLGVMGPAARAAYPGPVDEAAVVFYERLAPLYDLLRDLERGDAARGLGARLAAWSETLG
ncbi:MAG: phosphotransferase [Thermaerobacter sp.]|nr:phosphotransferase [Thermaerobacter sp.]